MMRPLPVLVLAVLAATLLAPVADAGPGIRYGIHDDAWLAHGAGTLEQRLDRLERLGVDVVRFNLHWDAIEEAEGAPVWEPADAVLQGLRDRGIDAVVGLMGAPAWANGGRPPNVAPRAEAFAAFAGAAAERYPWVRQWLVWNEPNQRRWLSPASPASYVKRLLNPAYAAIKAVNPGAVVAGGVTAPRAGSAGMSPVDFIRGMARAGARLDAYAHHPYPAKPSDTPFRGGCVQAGCETITMATLERLVSETARAFGPKPLWLTEYGYQTGALGVTRARQATLVAEAAYRAYLVPRVELLVHYLVADEPESARWQSGLYGVSGAAKPAARSFALPLVAASRRGARVVLWGQIRPRAGAQPYRLQVRERGGGWDWATGTRRTGANGVFRATVTVPAGASVRVWSPRDRAFGLAVRV